jgi:hypothetical protein
MSSSNLPPDSFQRLREFRSGLLRLHKALLDSERTQYEQQHGRIRSKGEFFQLVIEHEWFNWLRPISQFIVLIDETLSAKEPATLSQINDLLVQSQQLLHSSETGTPLETGLFRAIQRDPDIAFMHAEVSHLL